MRRLSFDRELILELSVDSILNMSAPVRSPLGDLTNLPDQVRRNLEVVATDKAVTIPLSEYNRILDQYNLVQGYIQRRELDVDTALLNLSARITGLEQRIEHGLRVAYGLTATHTHRSEQLRTQVLQALKALVEVMEA